MLGKGGKDQDFQDLLRSTLSLHDDEEVNVSAHATHLVGSALSGPFLSYSDGLQGLTGPLYSDYTLLKQMSFKITEQVAA